MKKFLISTFILLATISYGAVELEYEGGNKYGRKKI